MTRAPAASTEPFDVPESFNLADHLLDARVREGLGDEVALRVDAPPSPEGAAPGGAGETAETTEYTYRQVRELANRFGNVLRRLGVQPEQRVIVSLPDSAEYVGALFGILKIGAVAVMVNPGLQPEGLSRLYDYTRAPVAIVQGGAAGAAFVTARKLCRDACPGSLAEHAGPRYLLTVGGDESAGDESAADSPASSPRGVYESGADSSAPSPDGTSRVRWEDLGPAASGELEHARTHRDDPAVWLFSGGTTGRPKAVVQSHLSFANTTELYARRALGYRRSDVTLSVPKLFFGYATGSNLFFPFSVGATAVLFPEHPTPEVVFEKIRRHRPTILINVPTLINRMVSHEEAAEVDLSSLRFATSAGEALPAPLYHRWKDTFGVELLDGLGTAEMWHVFLTNLPGAVKPGTLGRAVPGFELAVRDDEGRDVEDGEVGRLWVRGRSRALCYWQESAKSEAALRGEWFVGGDLVSRDEEGYVTYHGRGDDVLKVGGKWLVPAEVEACLVEHPAVSECAVLGVTNDDGLTKPHAFILPAEGSTPGDDLAQQLKDHVIALLAPYKHPREVHFFETFPRTHLGKVDRGELRRRVTGSAD